MLQSLPFSLSDAILIFLRYKFKAVFSIEQNIEQIAILFRPNPKKDFHHVTGISEIQTAMLVFEYTVRWYFPKV